MDRTPALSAELDVELVVSKRYSAASQVAEIALCCSVQYDQRFLTVLPDELIERDYGCGDPSRHVREGEAVLDLGSGGGKVCYIASQIVGPRGRVIGIDMNDDMLALARRFREEIGSRIGWHNVEFRKGRIQDLALDLDEFDHFLRNQPIGTAADWLAAQRHAELLRSQSPMVATESIDVVLSNCVLNLVQPGDRRQLFSEVFRVLRPGGRAVISDIVSSAPVPGHLRGDPELWSGCVSGAFEEPELFTAFEDAGFIGLNVIDRQPAPWMVVEGIVFRSLTLQAMKPAIASGTETHGEVIYRGPWRQVVDDGGTELHRGRRTLVTGDTLARLRGEPYAEQVVIVAAGTNAEPAGELLPVAGENCCGPGKCC